MKRRPGSPRILLVEDRRSAGPVRGAVVPLRRFRLARLRLEAPPAGGSDSRFDYLKRVHD